MAKYNQTSEYSMAMMSILMKILQNGDKGATLQEIMDAYEDARGSMPDERTIRRIISKINMYFTPEAFDDDCRRVENEKALFIKKTKGKDNQWRYKMNQRIDIKTEENIKTDQTLFMA